VSARDSGESPAPSTDGVRLSVHGPNASIAAAVTAGVALKELYAEVAREMGAEGANLHITAVWFQCDGCGLQRPDRPSPDEGWTYSDGDDFCPTCTEDQRG
jgi:hypothetical protein